MNRLKNHDFFCFSFCEKYKFFFYYIRIKNSIYIHNFILFYSIYSKHTMWFFVTISHRSYTNILIHITLLL